MLDAAPDAPADAQAGDTDADAQASDADDATDDAATDAAPDTAVDAEHADTADAADATDDTARDVPDEAGDASAAIPAVFLDPAACDEVDGFGPVFPGVVERWGMQDDAGSPPQSPLLIVGSSSVRRWEGFAEGYAAYRPVQRGFGGSQLGEIALYADELVIRHDPRGVVVFAGTNDVAAGVPPNVIVQRFVCLRQRIGQGLDWSRPVLFIGITPTPSRWATWTQAAEVNDAVAALAAQDPAVTWVDVPSAFLATGSPPESSLFVGDMLHLSASGYALWDSVLRPTVETTVTPAPAGAGDALPPGTRVLIDLGPSDDVDGEPTPSPDHLGQHWNNWHELAGGGEVLPGEHIDDLTASDGEPTAIDLVVTGGFYANGWRNGGLRWPDIALLGDLAVGSATGDFFYALPEDATGGWFFRDLDPAATYTLRIFAGRSDAERRVTRVAVRGASSAEGTLVTSGAGSGSDGGDGNDDDVLELTGVRPDAWGQAFVDVSIDEGSYGYVSLVELVVE